MVPVMEELFWRSFLLRYLTHPDLQSPIGHVLVFALWLMVAASALAHPSGSSPRRSLAYALWLKKTRSLFSACRPRPQRTQRSAPCSSLGTGDWHGADCAVEEPAMPKKGMPELPITLTRYQWSKLWWMSSLMSGRLVQPCAECGAKLRLSSMTLVSSTAAIGLIAAAILYLMYQSPAFLFAAVGLLPVILRQGITGRVLGIPPIRRGAACSPRPCTACSSESELKLQEGRVLVFPEQSPAFGVVSTEGSGGAPSYSVVGTVLAAAIGFAQVGTRSAQPPSQTHHPICRRPPRDFGRG